MADLDVQALTPEQPGRPDAAALAEWRRLIADIQYRVNTGELAEAQTADKAWRDYEGGDLAADRIVALLAAYEAERARAEKAEADVARLSDELADLQTSYDDELRRRFADTEELAALRADLRAADKELDRLRDDASQCIHPAEREVVQLREQVAALKGVLLRPLMTREAKQLRHDALAVLGEGEGRK